MELKPCPFCVSDYLILKVGGILVKHARVRCVDCDATGPEICASSDEMAIEQASIAWNKRK